MLNLVIESAEISRGWAHRGSEQERGERAPRCSGAFWLPTAASGGVWAEFLRQVHLLGLTDSLGPIHSNRWRMLPLLRDQLSIRVQLPESRTPHRHQALITSPGTDEQGARKRIKKWFSGQPKCCCAAPWQLHKHACERPRPHTAGSGAQPRIRRTAAGLGTEGRGCASRASPPRTPRPPAAPPTGSLGCRPV